MNVSGSATLNVGGATGIDMGHFGGYSGLTGILTLGGGTVTTPIVQHSSASSGTYLLNFNGGMLRANAANTTFINNLTGAYVYGGGGTIDNGGNAITIGQALLAPSGSGIFTSGLSVAGSGYIDTPIVAITGGGGSGATAVATINYATGALTGVSITNPGTGYTTAPAFSLIGGGGTATLSGAVSLLANTSGGLTFQGSGTTTLMLATVMPVRPRSAPARWRSAGQAYWAAAIIRGHRPTAAPWSSTPAATRRSAARSPAPAA